MNRTGMIDRRTMLRGMGTAIALPMLETMMPLRAVAAEHLRHVDAVAATFE